MKDYLTIGEISRMFGLNVQTLYYYDSIGLFCPHYRDPVNGRRKYEFDQVYPLAAICYMRRLGYSLEEIRKQQSTQHLEQALESLEERSRKLKRQWQELLSVDEAIQRKVRFIKQEMQDIRAGEIQIKEYGPRKYFILGDEDTLYRHNSFYFYPTIAFYEGEKKYFGAYLDSNEERIPEFVPQDQIQEIPGGMYLCAYHLGGYETAPDTIRHMRESHPELKLEEKAINFNIVDQFVESGRENYITYTQIRILSGLRTDNLSSKM